MATNPRLRLSEGMLIQGDGSSSTDIAQAKPQKMYVIKGGKLDEIESVFDLRNGGHNSNDVKVVSDSELAQLQFAPRPRLASGGEIVLDLNSFLGAGHYMTTHGVLRRTPTGGHADATTRTRTVTWFGGYTGGVNMVYSDAAGFPVGMSATRRFGVDGTWVGRSDRTDYWSEDISVDAADRVTSIAIFHFWSPNQLDDVVRRAVAMVKPIVEIVAAVVALGGGGKKS